MKAFLWFSLTLFTFGRLKKYTERKFISSYITKYEKPAEHTAHKRGADK